MFGQASVLSLPLSSLTACPCAQAGTSFRVVFLLHFALGTLGEITLPLSSQRGTHKTVKGQIMALALRSKSHIQQAVP